jgi:CubicO group peptidase (beta-lactamase class C family)
MSASAQQLSGSIDRYLKNIKETHVMPGFSLVVVKDGKALTKGYGVESTTSKKLFTSTSVIAIGSLTKSFTALAIIKLVERRKISLDAPVTKYLPWFRTLNKEESDKITIKMLLNNTSGLYSPVNTPLYDLSDGAGEKFVRQLSSIYLYKTPGNSYEYNNTGFVVAGLVIRKVTENSFASFLETEIFKPLRMARTTLRPEEFGRLKSVPGEYPSIKGTIAAKREPEFESAEYAAAGMLLHSDAEDMGKYLLAHLNINKVLRKESRELLWSRYIDFPGLAKEDGGDGKRYSYGLGWMVSEIEGRTIIHHGGSTGKTSSFMMIDSANNIAAAILINLDLTFIDKYTHPTAFHILNNVMRLATNLNISDFGIPLVQDRTRNNYELSTNKQGKYTGEYVYSNGGDGVVYFGVDLTICKTQEGRLEGVIHRGNQVVNRFIVDNVNESVAVTRNIDGPEHIKFRITATGDITHVYFRNIEFRRQEADEGELYKLEDVHGTLRFRLPYTWTINLAKKEFVATNKANTITISGGTAERNDIPLKQIGVKSSGSSAEKEDESRMVTENIGALVWKEQTYSTEEANPDYSSMFVFTETTIAGYWFKLTAPKDQFTVAVQDVLRPLLISFRLL